MYETDGFIGADLYAETDHEPTMLESVSQLERFADEIARTGWFCRFYSRMSPADIHYLEGTLGTPVVFEDHLMTVKPDFRPDIELLLFSLETRGLYEIILMPTEDVDVDAETMVLAARDVLTGIVAAVGWDPFVELQWLADEPDADLES